MMEIFKMKKDHQSEKHHSKHNESAGAQAKVEEKETKTAELDLKAQLEEKQKEAAANYDKYLRAVADLENYKKRAARERADYIKYANENILRDLLTVCDNIERAREHATNSRDFDSFLEGLDMIQGQFRELLARYGVETVETKDREFDPNVHEAVMSVPGNAENDNKVVEEFEKGYMLNGRLLRPAKVSVAKNT
jgi:molecular chaperone GrpE